MTDNALAGRVALVTGASRGIGRVTAMHLRAHGARVAVNARDAARAEAAAREIGDDVLAAPGDIADERAARAMVDGVVSHFGRLDILVNNAAVAFSTPFAEIAVDEWRHTLDVNLTGAFVCAQQAAVAMKAQRHGRIINVASVAGRTVSTLAGAHYTASKAGMLGLTRAAAKELGQHGITVNAVCPGIIETELVRANSTPERIAALQANFPMRRIGQPEEVAELICHLASDAAGYITGASIDINGGALMI
jgi:3-oxoacyl-[acyl-carrier protein] reductase